MNNSQKDSLFIEVFVGGNSSGDGFALQIHHTSRRTRSKLAVSRFGGNEFRQ